MAAHPSTAHWASLEKGLLIWQEFQIMEIPNGNIPDGRDFKAPKSSPDFWGQWMGVEMHGDSTAQKLRVLGELSSQGTQVQSPLRHPLTPQCPLPHLLHLLQHGPSAPTLSFQLGLDRGTPSRERESQHADRVIFPHG